eukprot:1160404-Pelagomonas_calceolata.AAC.8
MASLILWAAGDGSPTDSVKSGIIVLTVWTRWHLPWLHGPCLIAPTSLFVGMVVSQVQQHM